MEVECPLRRLSYSSGQRVTTPHRLFKCCTEEELLAQTLVQDVVLQKKHFSIAPGIVPYLSMHWGRTGDKGLLFTAGIGCVLKSRNATCITKELVQIFELLREVRGFAEILLLCYSPRQTPMITVRWVSWHPSREEIVILNVDGSNRGNLRRAGVGGLLRQADGLDYGAPWIPRFY